MIKLCQNQLTQPQFEQCVEEVTANNDVDHPDNTSLKWIIAQHRQRLSTPSRSKRKACEPTGESPGKLHRHRQNLEATRHPSTPAPSLPSAPAQPQLDILPLTSEAIGLLAQIDNHVRGLGSILESLGSLTEPNTPQEGGGNDKDEENKNPKGEDHLPAASSSASPSPAFATDPSNILLIPKAGRKGAIASSLAWLYLDRIVPNTSKLSEPDVHDFIKAKLEKSYLAVDLASII